MSSVSEAHSDTFEQLQSRIRQLIGMYEELRTQNEQLGREKTELNEQSRLTEEKLKNLEEKYNKLKISKALIASSEDVHDAKLKVNRMVREIDKCIALLNR
jgi:predicted nuclease with TOPRIM domain